MTKETTQTEAKVDEVIYVSEWKKPCDYRVYDDFADNPAYNCRINDDHIIERVVLWHRLEDKSYITHIEIERDGIIERDGKERSYNWGNYDMSLLEAMKDFQERCDERGMVFRFNYSTMKPGF
jgi:hypothetical protein